MVKDPKKIAMGKKSRASGADFERRTRKDLEEDGWIVDKWSNNVELSGFYWDGKSMAIQGMRFSRVFIPSDFNKEIYDRHICSHFFPGETQTIKLNKIPKCNFIKDSSIIPAKHKFRGMGIPMAMGTGFPDFIIFKPRPRGGDVIYEETFDIIGVECKTNGYLDKTEKDKCMWYLQNNIFSKILIASKDKIKNKIVINYEEFKYE